MSREGINNKQVKDFSDDLYELQSAIRRVEKKHPEILKVYDRKYDRHLSEINRDIGQLIDNVGIELWDYDEAEKEAQP